MPNVFKIITIIIKIIVIMCCFLLEFTYLELEAIMNEQVAKTLLRKITCYTNNRKTIDWDI